MIKSIEGKVDEKHLMSDIAKWGDHLDHNE